MSKKLEAEIAVLEVSIKEWKEDLRKAICQQHEGDVAVTIREVLDKLAIGNNYNPSCWYPSTIKREYHDHTMECDHPSDGYIISVRDNYGRQKKCRTFLATLIAKKDELQKALAKIKVKKASKSAWDLVALAENIGFTAIHAIREEIAQPST